MKTTKEFIEHLNSLKIVQTGPWEESIPTDIWDKYFEDFYMDLDEGLDVDKHRWYELSTSVLEFENGFLGHKGEFILGIRHISNLYSEESSYEDMCHHLEFFEMEPIKTITYVKI